MPVFIQAERSRVFTVLTAVLSQARSRPQQHRHFASSSLDQLDGPRVGNAACRLPVNLHDLISDLSGTAEEKVIKQDEIRAGA